MSRQRADADPLPLGQDVVAPLRARQTCDGLTSLRGIAATLVVVEHCLQSFRVNGIDQAYYYPLDFTQPWLVLQHLLFAIFDGAAAVALFFVLSGTVLFLSSSASAYTTGSVFAVDGGYLAK